MITVVAGALILSSGAVVAPPPKSTWNPTWLCGGEVTYQANTDRKVVRKTMRKINRQLIYWTFIPHKSGWGRADITVKKYPGKIGGLEYRTYQYDYATPVNKNFIWTRVLSPQDASKRERKRQVREKLWMAAGVDVNIGLDAGVYKLNSKCGGSSE